MRFNVDDRATRLCDIFSEMAKGDINVSLVYPGTIAAWHKHQKQRDQQIVLKGSLKMGVCNYPEESYHQDQKIAIERFNLKEEWLKVGLPNIKNELNNTFFIDNYSKEEERQVAYKEYHNKRNVLERWNTEEPRVEFHILSEHNMNQGPLWIPSHLWHGSANNFSNETAILLYYITNKWDGTDEQRCSIDTMGYSWEKEVK